MVKYHNVLNRVKLNYVLTQRTIQSSGLLKVLYTSPPGRPNAISTSPPGRPNAISTSLGTIQSPCEKISFRFPPLSVARYLFIQLSD